MSNKSKTIMIIEDDEALNDAFTMVLTKAGYGVARAFNGKDALDGLDSANPDLIILDLLMPIMDGQTFLKSLDSSFSTPIIVLSNLDSKDEIDKAMDLGATRYMLKAWASPHELVRLVEDTLADTPVSKK